jgi:hypothetical protein
MATAVNGLGPLGSTCAGCVFGPWKDGKRPNVDTPAMRVLYGDVEIWLCEVTSATVTREQRGCRFYTPRNGQVTADMFPSKPKKAAP